MFKNFQVNFELDEDSIGMVQSMMRGRVRFGVMNWFDTDLHQHMNNSNVAVVSI